MSMKRSYKTGLFSGHISFHFVFVKDFVFVL